jgi:cyanophycinase-like exopeptidase
MVKLHRTLIQEAGDGPRAMLDTPFGFQANADDLTDKIQEYFSESVGESVEAARWRRRDEPVAERERTLALLRRASWAFAGPGSPSYALRQWQGTPVPRALVEVIERGGTVVLGSAAAVTVGSHAIPVYEIYKVGDDPIWLEGLDLLGSVAGFTAAVVPHYDNREGGRHDTRFCYLGEQRLELLEAALPDGVGVLGVDEHTAVVIDVAAGTATVHGVGGLTLRYRERSEIVPTGESIRLQDMAALLSGTREGHVASVREVLDVDDPAETLEGAPSLRGAAAALKVSFDTCLAVADADGALAACLDLEDAIHAWSADTLQGDDLDVARQTLRAMLVELARAAVLGLRDARAVLGPVVDVALAARQQARESRDYAASDAIRDGLAAAGVDVRDTPTGMEWSLHEA